MCNRYASDIRKAGLEGEYFGFEEFSHTRIPVIEAFPDRPAPVIRQREDGKREWVSMRWGLPGPSAHGQAPVTNIRNLASPHWRPWLTPEHRCLVPFTLFAEYDDHTPKGAKKLAWFARPDRGMAMFAGFWRSWRGARGPKSAPVEGEHLLFSFLTTDANDLIRPVHAKAMPMILTSQAEYAQWLNAPAGEVEALQARHLAPDMLERVADDEAEAIVPSLAEAKPNKQGALF
jgi:putative SOS response-associated peptidase YedK